MITKYLEYIKSFYPTATISKTNGELLRFAFWGNVCRDSLMGAEIPIWEVGGFKPAPVSWIRGKAELLSGMAIVKKLDLTVNFGIDQFKVG